MSQSKDTGHAWTDWCLDKVLRGVILAMLALPYRSRVPTMGWIMRKLIAPIAGYNRRSFSNLEYIFPDMPIARQREIVDGVADNMGRTFIENYSTNGLSAILANSRLCGDGLSTLEDAKKNGKPVILVSGHFGNYQTIRLALSLRKYDIGALYRPATNKYFNRHYEESLKSAGGKMFARGRQGTIGFVRHLVKGGILAFLPDQHVSDGENILFLGKPAATSLTPARLALRFNAHLIPVYATRCDDGLHFELFFEDPIPHGDPDAMTRDLNKSLEARIESHPEQWLWVHKRWKIDRRAT